MFSWHQTNSKAQSKQPLEENILLLKPPIACFVKGVLFEPTGFSEALSESQADPAHTICGLEFSADSLTSAFKLL